MQQPDSRDQSEPEVKGQTDEHCQSDSDTVQRQEITGEQEEKETDEAPVSFPKSP